MTVAAICLLIMYGIGNIAASLSPNGSRIRYAGLLAIDLAVIGFLLYTMMYCIPC